jgi:CRP-like cAMP-binding protein
MEWKQIPIFLGVTQEEYDEMTACGCIRLREYQKDMVIFRMGDKTQEFGVLLSGEVHIESSDLWGNRVILHTIAPGQAFAETYAFCRVPMMVDVTAVRESRILFLNINTLLPQDSRDKSWYSKMLYNLLLLSTGKNLAWSSRVFCISAKSIRARVMTYLSSQARREGSMEITIPFDRQQMADYLNVERSALSKELGRMKREGILAFHKNRFRILRPGSMDDLGQAEQDGEG